MYLVENELNARTINLRVDADYVYISDLADVHVGALHHHKKKFEDTIKLVQSVPNFYVIIGGDCTESSGIHTKSSVFSEDIHGLDQIKALKTMLLPIKHKILFIRSGNHGHERAMRNNALAPEAILAELLEVPYMQGFGCAILNARKNTYCIGTQHNSKKPDKFGWLQGMDVSFYEHKHLHGYEREAVASVNRFSKTWTIREALHVQAGSFLSWGSYAIDNGYKPQFTGTPVVELSGIANKWATTVYESIDQFKRAVGVK